MTLLRHIPIVQIAACTKVVYKIAASNIQIFLLILCLIVKLELCVASIKSLYAQ